MTITPITDANTWNTFILAQAPNTFLQSWEWGQVQIADGEDVSYLGFFENQTQIAAALVITVNARRGRHYFVPHGPIIVNRADITQVIQELTQYLKAKADHDKAVALRISPLLEMTEDNRQVFTQAGFRPAPMHVHAELTWMLDITGPEPMILAGMRKTTRHAITKAQKAGVTVSIETSPAALERFWPLYEATRDRHKFILFSSDLIRSQLYEFGKHNGIYTAIASYQGKDIAAAIMIQFGSTIFYYHGASQKMTEAPPAAQLLQWESIKEAKRRGATTYNFWGIAPDNQPNHPFAGITVFKKGFGGYPINYMHAQDLPLSLEYWKLWLVETIRKFKRGF